jgi:hypothetical protein
MCPTFGFGHLTAGVPATIAYKTRSENEIATRAPHNPAPSEVRAVEASNTIAERISTTDTALSGHGRVFP